MPELTRKRRRGAADAARATEERIQRDLRARGVASALARPLATRLAPRAEGLSEDAYALFLDGVAAVHVQEQEEPAPATPTSGAGTGTGAVELQRLMQDFATELKKLDEGLRLLSAYLLRIRDRTTRQSSRTLH